MTPAQGFEVILRMRLPPGGAFSDLFGDRRAPVPHQSCTIARRAEYAPNASNPKKSHLRN
jgi:hypothetical protein